MNFSEIHKQYYDRVFRICLGFSNDSDKAKDLTQETFIAVWQNLENFREEASIGTWIFRIATNKCLRSIQKDKNHPKLDLEEAVQQVSAPEETPDEKIALLRKLISNLSEIDRIIITLFMEGVPQEEIATVTGLSHSNIRVKVHRIKEVILKKFKDHGKF